MEYEVEPRRIGSSRRPGAAVIVASVVACGVVAVGLAAALLGPDPPPASRLADATRAPEAPPAVRPAAVSTLAPPVQLDCTTVARRDCAAAIFAVRLLVGASGGIADQATVYPSLLCRDDFDCPRPFLAGAEPLGSVILDFEEGGPMWVNVVRPTGGHDPPRARVIR